MALCFSLSSREGGLLPPEENQNDLILLCSLLTHMPHILFSVTLMLTLVPVEGSLNFPDRSQSFSARSGIMCLTLPYRLLMENTHFLLLFAELAILPFFFPHELHQAPMLETGSYYGLSLRQLTLTRPATPSSIITLHPHHHCLCLVIHLTNI